MLTYGVAWNRSFLWRLEVVLLHINVRDDVIITICVFTRSKVPWFVFGIIISLLEPLELIIKVYNIICLLIPQSSILISCEDISHILSLCLLNSCLRVGIVVYLSDRVVKRFLLFDKLLSYFFVGGRFTLEITFLLYVFIYVGFPLS